MGAISRKQRWRSGLTSDPSRRDSVSIRQELPAQNIRRESSSESLRGTSFRPRGLFFPIFRRGIGLKRMKKPSRYLGDFINCGQEDAFVGLRRFGKTADLSNKLQRSSSNFLRSNRRIEVEKRFDIPTH